MGDITTDLIGDFIRKIIITAPIERQKEIINFVIEKFEGDNVGNTGALSLLATARLIMGVPKGYVPPV